MSATPRHHHYLPQCYLKGFSKAQSKKSKIQVYDFRRNKHFETIARNVGGERDFNRIDLEGVDPTGLETRFASFEGELAKSLARVNEKKALSEEDRMYVLNLAAMMLLRTPQMRQHWRQNLSSLAETIMSVQLSSEGAFEASRQEMLEGGYEGPDVTFEEAKDFFERKEYTFNVKREYHIYMELQMLIPTIEALSQRNWLLLHTDDKTDPFITSDNPVILTWKNPEDIPPFYRNSPGLAMSDTSVYFPVSSRVMLVGEFEISEAVSEAGSDFVALANGMVCSTAHERVFAPRSTFRFKGPGGIEKGKDVMKYVNPE